MIKFYTYNLPEVISDIKYWKFVEDAVYDRLNRIPPVHPESPVWKK